MASVNLPFSGHTCRNAATLESLVESKSSLLQDHRQGLVFIEDPVSNSVSSSALRKLIAQVSCSLYFNLLKLLVDSSVCLFYD